MKKAQLTDLDRLAVRERPEGQPIMHQDWGKLLFMHWRMDEAKLRPLIPERLTIDTFDGSAWVGVTPFTMWDIRALPPFLPPVPGLSSMHELNVRTYVHLDGVPGVWFFSLDANSSVAVLAARTVFHLPYFNAEMELEQEGQRIVYSSKRTERDAAPAKFDATWEIGETLAYSHPGSLEFFLTERYLLYAAHKQKLYSARIFHEPWPLRKATLSSLDSTMIESHGLPAPKDEPLLHYAEEISVDIWPIKECKSQEGKV
ncbi:MAG TPA: DUF2071 domain-containing protein [Pyrinomonadaceae bacterium]|nr:DUF2071 domain-containing protein [Pyrinomonadaceae bacterium]